MKTYDRALLEAVLLASFVGAPMSIYCFDAGGAGNDTDRAASRGAKDNWNGWIRLLSRPISNGIDFTRTRRPHRAHWVVDAGD